MAAAAPGFDPLIAEAKQRMRRRRLLVVAAMAVVLLAGVTALGVNHWQLGMASPSARAALPTLLGNAGPHYSTVWGVRPSKIVDSGDGAQIIGGFDGDLGKTGGRSAGHLNWVTWTPRMAVGRGAIWQNDCIPYCARGRYVARRLTVKAFRPVRGRFTRLTLIYALQRVGHYTETLGVSRAHGFWAYGPVVPYTSAQLARVLHLTRSRSGM